ncbi:unnamed protein product [Commensalibacter communis]|uniref:Dit-like phage tail protein N-terminal domain-containing protein n=1 Tax=Commensalibacter communis TaxID=2972786 RepID=A0A9W4TR57_9PROT|nr:hypothetical protein [Commensalibacter communis]CAI3941533.1 unnamed protein product [Commensalibacter communis]CAI3945095.1 unnamed protein product [Commensalibacter communis]CAI3959268.1 unnamed protein product [Commensalibacter communis]CAI3960826.1 unnamed protein product [Commensalibacter communis]
MAGKTSIGLVDVAGSHAMAQGWKLITDYVNKNSRFGIFTKDGNPFYEGLVDYDNSISFLNDEIKLGDNVQWDGIVSFGDTSGVGKNLVECGIQSYNYTHSVNVSNAPVEDGSFISLNMTRNPFQGQVTYLSTGTEKQRAYFEKALNAAVYRETLFFLHSRQIEIENIKITSYTISQSAENSGQLLKYLVSFQEIQKTAIVTNALEDATPFSGTGQNVGQLQMQDATGSQQQAARKLP